MILSVESQVFWQTSRTQLPKTKTLSVGCSRSGAGRTLRVWVMQTQLFPSSIKEVASVESVQLGLCDPASLANLSLTVRELAIYFGVSHEVLRAFGALFSKVCTRWRFCGCAVVFLCLLRQRVVL